MKVDGRPSNNVYLRKASVLKRAVIYEAGRLDAAVWATQFGWRRLGAAIFCDRPFDV